VSKVLCNATDPDPEPEHKMVGLLGKQQAAAYLSASAELDASYNYEQPSRLQQQHLDAHVAASAQAAAAGALPSAAVELPPAATNGSAAHVLLQLPSRAAYTDGGVVPCSVAVDTSGVAAAAAGAALARHSLDVQQGSYIARGGSGSSTMGSISPGTPSSAATASTATEVPSAVAVIETRTADGKKQVLGVSMELEGGKGVGGMILRKQMPPPAFVQLANMETYKQC
jgi:hypothetical protein